ncbi:MAG: DUF4396 domain-containing protein [Nitrosomonas sp.]|nr:MAG: DUF4396 domain-containing protein [Nitrosomonas sp.]
MKEYEHNHKEQLLNSIALMATVHCLSGCALGEIAGMVIGTALGWSNAETIALATVLAFLSGYLLTMLPIIRAGYGYRAALRIALVSDTASITIMEIADNLIMLSIPEAMAAPLDSVVFWSSLVLALIIAGIVAFPVNRWLIARGRGHAVAHHYHCG